MRVMVVALVALGCLSRHEELVPGARRDAGGENPPCTGEINGVHCRNVNQWCTNGGSICGLGGGDSTLWICLCTPEYLQCWNTGPGDDGYDCRFEGIGCRFGGHASCNELPTSGFCSCSGGRWSCKYDCPRECPLQPPDGQPCSLPGDVSCPYTGTGGESRTCRCVTGVFVCDPPVIVDAAAPTD